MDINHPPNNNSQESENTLSFHESLREGAKILQKIGSRPPSYRMEVWHRNLETAAREKKERILESERRLASQREHSLTGKNPFFRFLSRLIHKYLLH